MIKTLTNLRKQEKEKFVVPKGVQDVIPITAIYDDGIFQIGKDKFSKTYKFSDINYAVASREDKEAMFFGLSLRQFIFSACACVVAVGIYFLLKPYIGTETVSWMCILGAAPFAALGFIKYNGMTAEKFIYAWIKSEFLMPKKLTFRSTNTYYELFKPSIEAKAKEAMKSND